MTGHRHHWKSKNTFDSATKNQLKGTQAFKIPCCKDEVGKL